MVASCVRSNVSVATGCCESACSVSGVMNFVAAGVITTRTSAPAFTRRRTNSAALYAAMPPETPTRMRRFASAGSISGKRNTPSIEREAPAQDGDEAPRRRGHLRRDACAARHVEREIAEAEPRRAAHLGRPRARVGADRARRLDQDRAAPRAALEQRVRAAGQPRQ